MKKQLWLVLLALLFAVGTVAADDDDDKGNGNSHGYQQHQDDDDDDDDHDDDHQSPDTQSPPVTDAPPVAPPATDPPPDSAPEVANPSDSGPAPDTDPPADPGNYPSDPDNGPGNGQEKITLCHVVPKTPHSITVADPAKVQAHLDHGDTVGGCDNEMAAPAAGLGSVITLCSQHGGGTGHQLTVSPVGRVSHIRISCD